MINRIKIKETPDAFLKQAKKPAGAAFEAVLRSSMDTGNSPAPAVNRILAEFLAQMINSLLVRETDEDALYTAFLPPLLSEKAPASLNTAVSNKGQTGQDFEPVIAEAAEKYQVDPALIRSIISVESGGNPQAVSRAGASGLMQLMPGTWTELGVTDPFDPAQNIMAGTCYLKKLLNRYHGNVNLALAAYNWGMGNLEKQPEAMPNETRRYISLVNRYRDKFSATA